MVSVRVLVVEDEDVLADAIAEGLRRQGFAVDVAYDGSEGLDRALEDIYDVVVLDRDLPLLHGDDVCQSLGEESIAARVLMLTASGTVDQRVEGLGLGADDYLAKPFAFAELVARVHALGRRQSISGPSVLQCGDLAIDSLRRVATRDGRDLNLTRKELAVVEVLARADGAPVTAERLLDAAWDANADPSSHVVRQTVLSLRRKLGEPPLVHTVIGSGYRLATT